MHINHQILFTYRNFFDLTPFNSCVKHSLSVFNKALNKTLWRVRKTNYQVRRLTNKEAAYLEVLE